MNTKLGCCTYKCNAVTEQLALWYLEQLQDALTPRSLKSHVVTPFGTSFLGVTSVGGFGLQGTNRSMRAPAQLHHCTHTKQWEQNSAMVELTCAEAGWDSTPSRPDGPPDWLASSQNALGWCWGPPCCYLVWGRWRRRSRSRCPLKTGRVYVMFVYRYVYCGCILWILRSRGKYLIEVIHQT